jgi:protoporphyrin/coproporphyrin ferrochelatase
LKPTGLLLLNLGSPAAPTPAAVGQYLREFLMDEYVIDIPAPLRWALVNLAIVPRRKYASAKLYQTIWTDAGSPLLRHTEALAAGLRAALGEQFRVAVGMRYGKPSTADGLSELLAAGVERVLVLPLYPQYAESSFETAVQAAQRAAMALGCADRLEILPPFYDQPGYLDASAALVREHLEKQPAEHVIFSYHSLPVRHLKRLDTSGQHCQQRADCCAQLSAVNARCYRAQCVFTTRALAERLELPAEQYSLSFQSRLGRQEWIGPQTEQVLKDLAARGVKRVAVSCPSFTADCLETLEEIAVRARETFLHAGGHELSLIPALNAHPIWVQALAAWVRTRARSPWL